MEHTISLSDRQAEVFALLMMGASEKQIAVVVGLTRHTVHAHVKSLYRKFHANSRGELFAHFLRISGIIVPVPASASWRQEYERVAAERARPRGDVEHVLSAIARKPAVRILPAHETSLRQNPRRPAPRLVANRTRSK